MDEGARVDAVKGALHVEKKGEGVSFRNEARVDRAGENRKIVGAGFAFTEAKLESGET